MKKVYLGDSVYVEFDGYHLILTTENGLPEDPSNTIALEPGLLEAIIRYQEMIRDELTRKPCEKET